VSDKKPKTKKDVQRLKNKKDWLIFLQSERQRANVDIAAPVIETPPAPAPAHTPEQQDEQTYLQKRETMQRSIDERRGKARDRWKNSSFSSGSAGGRAR